MAYPVRWLDETFDSRTRAEALLRPDLESGLITEHDFNLATTFLPGYHRYWPYTYGSAATLGTASYGKFFRKPPWGPQRTIILSTVAYFTGALIGQLQRARAHFEFTRSLDNPRGFAQALQNVNVRVGGQQPLTWTLPQVREIPPPTVDSRDIHGDTARPDEGGSVWAPDMVQSSASPRATNVPSQTHPPTGNAPRPKSRWEEIRSANAAGARPSSWDVLRQRHERAAAAVDVTERTSTTFEYNQKDRERAEEQARFDAILEAERKLARD